MGNMNTDQFLQLITNKSKIQKTIIPDGAVPLDFNSWRNYIRRARYLSQINNQTIDFNFSERREMLSLRIVWVDSYDQQDMSINKTGNNV